MFKPNLVSPVCPHTMNKTISVYNVIGLYTVSIYTVVARVNGQLASIMPVTSFQCCVSKFPNICEFFSDADNQQLFSRISHNVTHVLKPLLPTGWVQIK